MLTTPHSEESIFDEALAQPSPEARAEFLDAACGDDAGLRARVVQLLKSHTGAGSFLNKPMAMTADQGPIERPGTIIGSYKLLQQIGEGGMGVVYMADQEHPVRRRVALKIIKPGMDSRQVIARFEAERQALAMMDHQNIARVLDAGTTESGRPYFVMELVHGVPITKFCEDNRLTLRQRLELFVPVCQAIQHAHQKGVIHRDIKPTNILVTMYDDKPVPKVIDFGVAKAVEQRLTEKTLFTQYGMLVGTFEYMSPEQAEMNAFGVDTRSDIYSLGVLLYELLTGTTPIERAKLREAALVDLVRLIKEEEPPRPSVRLSTSGTLPKFAAACGTQAAQLPKQVRGELDWIVMKCLEKDRTRRYETVNGLARDVQRYLKDEPVEACPPSLIYRFKKLARKHRGLLTTVASFAALLLTGSVVSGGLAAWAIRAERTAQSALAKERMALEQAVTAKERAESYSQRLRTATQLVSEGSDYYNRSNWALAHDRFTKAAQIEPDLSSIYANRGALYTTLGLWDRAAADYDRSFQLATRFSANTFNEHATLKLYLGDDAAYRRICQEKQFVVTTTNNDTFCWLHACVLSPQPVGDPSYLVQRAERLVSNWFVPWTLHACALAHLRAGNYEESAKRSREALKFPESTGIYRCNNLSLAMALHHLGKHDEAQQALAQAEETIDGWIKIMADGSPGAPPVDWYKWLGTFIVYREAKLLLSGGPLQEDPRLVMIRERALAAITYGDAFTFMEEGRQHLKRQLWDQAAASFAKVLDQLPQGFRSASQEMRFCLEMVEQPEVFARLVEQRPRDRRLWHARGRSYATRRDWAKAISDFEKTLDLNQGDLLRVQVPSNEGPQIGQAVSMIELGALQLLAGDRAGYRDLCAAIIKDPLESSNPMTATGMTRACSLTPDAVSDWSFPLELASNAVRQQPRVAWYVYSLGIAQHRAGQHEKAIQTLNKSLEVHSAWIGRGQNYAVLAMACSELGRADEARDWLSKAQASLKDMDAAIARNRFGYAGADYLGDWLTLNVLLREAEKRLADDQKP